MTQNINKIPWLALLSLIAGCGLSPRYERPAAPVPAAYEGAAAGPAVTADWWRRFGSAELDALMDQAMAANQDLAAAVSRIRQARAQARIAGAAQLPTIDAGGSVSRSWRGEGPSPTGNGQAQIGVSYEVDLWGANAAQADAAEHRLAATIYDRDSVALVLQAEVASQYLQILALQDRLAIARSNLEAAKQVLDLVSVRFKEGANSGLEVAQQQGAVFSLEAQIPALEQQIKTTRNALAVLLGRAPQGFAVQGASLKDVQLPAVGTEQPAALLERRPDIQEAEARLRAAHADIGAARAALYPSLTLSASAGLTGLLTSGADTIATLTASLAQSIFDGGRRRGQVELAQAQRTELVAQYTQAVLIALREVQDSLVTVESNEARSKSLAQAAAQAREAFQIATVRYQNGASDLLTVLDSQRSQLQTEDSLIQAELARYTATTTLFKALGGGWRGP